MTGKARPKSVAGGSEELPRMGLLEHLEELRKRIVVSLAAVFVAFLGCFAVAEHIYAFLERPVRGLLPEGTRLAFTSLTQPFLLYIKVAALAAIFVAMPVLLSQVWGFVAPGLYRRERRYAAGFIIAGSLFFVGGAAFGYWIAFPRAAKFLLQVGERFDAILTVDNYFSFLLTLLLGLGMMFQLPVLVFLFSQLGLVTPRFLMRHFRWAVLLIFFVSALITPTPDIVNMSLFAVPTLVLYLLGVGAAALAHRRKAREAAALAATEP
jgi:sec-independent protein translocase protein TatC